jgi:Flp pilus assembly protein TadG
VLDDSHDGVAMSVPGRTGSTPRRSRGQALVEFALVFPAIVLLLFGAIDLGRAVFAYSTIANAAREAARVAVVNQIFVSPDPSTAADCAEQKPVEDAAHPHWSIRACAVSSAISLGVLPADVHVAYSAPPGTTLQCTSPADATPASDSIDVGCIASVTVGYSLTPLTPLISAMFPAIDMSSTSQMPIERLFP